MGLPQEKVSNITASNKNLPHVIKLLQICQKQQNIAAFVMTENPTWKSGTAHTPRVYTHIHKLHNNTINNQQQLKRIVSTKIPRLLHMNNHWQYY